jgi:PAS domain S-box-containing protein
MADTEVPRERLLEAEIEWLRSQLAEPTAVMAAIRNGEVDAFVVSEKLGEKIYALRSADPPYRLMVEGMGEGAATVAADGTILYANPRLAEIVGTPAEALRGSSFRDFVEPDDGTAFDALLAENGAGHGEISLRRRDGRGVSAQLAVNRFHDDVVSGYCVIVTDLTEQKLHASIAASERSWREANRRKDEFLATLAHELRVPLAAIGNAIDILNRLGGSEPRVKWARGIISRQVRHLARMVDDLLDVSRIVNGKIELARETVDLRSLISGVVDYYRPLIEEQKRRFVVSLPETSLPVEGDSTRIGQIAANLLQNALKFTRENGTISVDLAARSGRAVLQVRDDGVGIPAEMLDRVFDLFTQAGAESGRGAQGGLGIGLTLVRRMVELHGGTVEVRSAGPDRGSEFVVSLPLSGEPGATARPAPAGAPGQAEICRKVLIVEDHRDTAEGLAVLLRMQGHEVITAYDGVAAFSRCEDFRPDTVLLDIGLPEMDGYEVGRRIRERLGKDVLIVALTGFGQEEDRRLSAEAGIDHHLLKPVRSDVLAELLQRGRETAS